ncbi:uncharacterized protein LOC111073504 isoform X2 [Drosophila obscura]|nr:uncharacterized protein LOC111073504 isoform X2 [Drosophila obscura]
MAMEVVMRACRKRGDVICQLLKTKEYYKRKAMESTNKVHMYRVMIEVAEERNNELYVLLMKDKMNTIQTHSFKFSLIADKEQLLRELDFRKRENEELQAVVDQRKAELCAAQVEQRTVRNLLTQKELVVVQLRLQNTDLINEVRMLRSLHRGSQLREERINKELQHKSEMIAIMEKELSLMKEGIREWNDNELKENEQQLRPLIDQLQDLSRDGSFLRTQTAQDSNSRNSVFQILWPTSLARKHLPTMEQAFPFFFNLKYILGA